eukprot:jgi/Galph1/5416/GphlegSOOS_G4086.1
MPQPASIRSIHDQSLSSWLNNIPLITRAWLLGSFIVTLLSGLKLLPLGKVILNWAAIWYHLELWRLVFSAFFLGGLGIGLLFNLIFIWQYSKSVEENVFFHDPADYLFMLLFCTVVLWLIDACLFKLFYIGPSLLFSVIYLWSKYNPTQPVSIWGLVQIPGKYIPFVFVLLDLLTSGGLNLHGLAGIIAGHCWYFVDKIYPTLPGNNGRKLLSTPQFLRHWLPRRSTGLSSGPIPPSRSTAFTNTTFTTRGHAWGPGRRLGE